MTTPERHRWINSAAIAGVAAIAIIALIRSCEEKTSRAEPPALPQSGGIFIPEGTDLNIDKVKELNLH